jgi:hypothetical protein
MQIAPSNSTLFALSQSLGQTGQNQGVRPQNEAARNAAKAIFAQLQAPAKPASASGSFQSLQAPTGVNLPASPPAKPMPRGSFLNILV